MPPTRSIRSLWLVAALTSGCERRVEPQEPPVQAADDTLALRRLFAQAEACADRYQCPPLAELQTRAERPGELRVLQLAFDLMADPKTGTFERLFKIASATARAWAAARTTEGRRLSSADEQELRKQVLRLLERPDNAVPAHGFVEYLSDAREIFQREALDPRRGNEEVHSAIRGLRERERDLGTVAAWLAAAQERPMIAGALLLDVLDHSGLEPAAEAALLLEFARRTDAAPEAARLVASHAAAHEEPVFATVVAAFAHHRDPAVREAAAAGAPRPQ